MEVTINTEGLPENYAQLVREVEISVVEAKKFFNKDNKSASTRARVALSNLSKIAKESRAQILEARS